MSPYIKPTQRRAIDLGIEAIPRLMEAGRLNYTITSLCNQYVDWLGENYASLNEVMGVLACVQAEFYRRRVSPYEDEKILLNGDVYGQPRCGT